jgi:hypothetical protein
MPTKQDIIDILQRIASESTEGRVSLAAFHTDTGWDAYWFNKYWPESGYRGACEEAGVLPGLMVGVDINCRVSDEAVSLKLAEAIEKNRMRFPSLPRFRALSKLGGKTICRGEEYRAAKQRLIKTYLSLPADDRSEAVERAMRDELQRLSGTLQLPNPVDVDVTANRSIRVTDDFIANVREFRNRGEEEQRQLVARFFVEVLGYRRTRVRSEHERNDVRVHDRKDRPWLVVEVKPSLDSDRHRKSARRQGFDYAHRIGLRYVVISDGDYYEVYDRFAGERLAYDEMRQGNFRLTSLRSRDNDLLSLLAAER